MDGQTMEGATHKAHSVEPMVHCNKDRPMTSFAAAPGPPHITTMKPLPQSRSQDDVFNIHGDNFSSSLIIMTSHLHIRTLPSLDVPCETSQTLANAKQVSKQTIKCFFLFLSSMLSALSQSGQS